MSKLFGVALLSVVLSVVVGFLIKLATGRSGITWRELAVVCAAMVLLFAPLTVKIGWSMGVDNVLEHQQFVNGVETEAIDDVIECYAGRAGDDDEAGKTNCHYFYDTGEWYTWYEWVSETSCTIDSDGNQQCTPEMVRKSRTSSVYAPYLKREHRYTVKASMGGGGSPKPYRYPDVYADANPEPFDRSVAIPGNIPRGAPESWLESKRRIDAGDPKPVTMLVSYDNPILGSRDEILMKYSGNIARYLEAGVLPASTYGKEKQDVLKGPTGLHADKVSFVQVGVSNPSAWQDSVMRFNAALGMELQGDLHVVVVDDQVVPATDAVTYSNAVLAHWQDPEVYGKRALAKNAIVLIIGTDGQTVTWAETATGMPYGNQSMFQEIRDWLPGTPLIPRDIFGEPRTVIRPSVGEFASSDLKVTYGSPRGALEFFVFEKAPFKRASMGCSGEEDACVGFSHLVDKIEPTTGQKAGIVIVTVVLAIVLWLIVAFTDFVDVCIRTVLSFFTGKKQSPADRYETNYPDWR